MIFLDIQFFLKKALFEVKLIPILINIYYSKIFISYTFKSSLYFNFYIINISKGARPPNTFLSFSVTSILSFPVIIYNEDLKCL